MISEQSFTPWSLQARAPTRRTNAYALAAHADRPRLLGPAGSGLPVRGSELSSDLQKWLICGFWEWEMFTSQVWEKPKAGPKSNSHLKMRTSHGSSRRRPHQSCLVHCPGSLRQLSWGFISWGLHACLQPMGTREVRAAGKSRVSCHWFVQSLSCVWLLTVP